MAPHCVCPITSTRRVPYRAAANSTLPTCEGATMLPATRMTNRSPNPWSKISSAGTRESEHPRTMANGCCPAAKAMRREAGSAGEAVDSFAMNRRLPAMRRDNASCADVIGVGALSGVKCLPLRKHCDDGLQTTGTRFRAPGSLQSPGDGIPVRLVERLEKRAGLLVSTERIDEVVWHARLARRVVGAGPA